MEFITKTKYKSIQCRRQEKGKQGVVDSPVEDLEREHKAGYIRSDLKE